jgi:hypothetical protein
VGCDGEIEIHRRAGHLVLYLIRPDEHSGFELRYEQVEALMEAIGHSMDDLETQADAIDRAKGD